MTVDLYKPHIVIKCNSLLKASDISKLLKESGVLTGTEIVYAFLCYGHYIKIGMTDNNSKMTGERVYRQAANINGWDDPLPRSSCGKDIIPSLTEFEDEYGFEVHVDGVEIHIWNVSNFINENSNQSNAKSAEDQLLTQYEEDFGHLPIGNPKDTRPRSYVHRTTFDSLFLED